MGRPRSYERDEGYVDVHIRLRRSDYDAIQRVSRYRAEALTAFMRRVALEEAEDHRANLEKVTF